LCQTVGDPPAGRATAAVRSRLDVFGVIVLAGVTALGGGVVRDVLLGVTPPTTLRQWPYLIVPAVIGLAVWRFHPAMARWRRAMLLADALGLALFATTGTSVALAASLGGVAVVVGDALGLPASPVIPVGAALVAVVRIVALWRHWNVPLSQP